MTTEGDTNLYSYTVSPCDNCPHNYWKTTTWTYTLPDLTEERVREIFREELKKAMEQMLGGTDEEEQE